RCDVLKRRRPESALQPALHRGTNAEVREERLCAPPGHKPQLLPRAWSYATSRRRWAPRFINSIQVYQPPRRAFEPTRPLSVLREAEEEIVGLSAGRGV